MVSMCVDKYSFDNFAGFSSIWLILPRSSPPLEICRWFPQIVFILLTRVRPINVGFSNRFFCLSDKRFLNIIIKNDFVTLYDLELKIISFSNPPKKCNFKRSKTPPKIHLLQCFFWYTKKTVWKSDIYWPHTSE